MKILVIIPAYNEEESILTTVQTLKNVHPEVDAIVVNDASKDNTKKILSENHIHYLDLPVNLGIGGGVQAGYMYAYRRKIDGYFIKNFCIYCNIILFYCSFRFPKKEKI